jgi:hypothetical protein
MLRHAEKTARIQDQIARKTLAALNEAQASDKASLENIQRRLEARLDDLQREAVSHADALAARLSEKMEIAKIATLLAKDKIQSTHDTAAYLATILEPVSTPMAKIEGLTMASLGEIQCELESHSNKLSANILHTIGTIELEEEVDIRSLSPALGEIVSGIQAQQISQSLTVALAPIDFACVVGVVGVLRVLLNRIVERAATTAGMNVAQAAADGPLPIGDLLALAMDLGFMAWTTYDIFTLSSELPGRIREQIVTGVETQKNTALAAFKQQAAIWLGNTDCERTGTLQDLLNPR